MSCAGLCVLLLGLWVTWSHLASRRLKAAVDAIAARHEPLTVEQVEQAAASPDADSAATIMAAIAAMDRNVFPPAATSLVYPGYPPFPPEWHKAADAAIPLNAKSLALARQARIGMTQKPGLGSNPFANVGALNGARGLANLLGDAALHAHLHDDDAEAIERIRDLRHLARVVNSHPGLIEYLVSVGIGAIADERLEVIAPGLRIEGGAIASVPGAGANRPVTRRAVRELITELLDEQDWRRRERLAILMERAQVYSKAAAVRDQSTILMPMFDLDMVRLFENKDFYLRALDQPTWPATRAFLTVAAPAHGPPWTFGPRNDPKAPRYSRIVSAALNSPLDRFILNAWRLRAERRLVAADLAIQLYRADHGQWPADPKSLVPDYLPLVPSDPSGPSDQPLGYTIVHSETTPRQRPLLFFKSQTIPEDQLAFSRNKANSPPPEPAFGWQGRMAIQWRDVSRWFPAAPATTAPSTQP